MTDKTICGERFLMKCEGIVCQLTPGHSGNHRTKFDEGTTVEWWNEQDNPQAPMKDEKCEKQSQK